MLWDKIPVQRDLVCWIRQWALLGRWARTAWFRMTDLLVSGFCSARGWKNSVCMNEHVHVLVGVWVCVCVKCGFCPCVSFLSLHNKLLPLDQWDYLWCFIPFSRPHLSNQFRPTQANLLLNDLKSNWLRLSLHLQSLFTFARFYWPQITGPNQLSRVWHYGAKIRGAIARCCLSQSPVTLPHLLS